MANYIILDAGHAKVTAGKRSPDGTLLEWEFNNDMQYRLKKRLEQLGFTVYLVNPNPEKGTEVSLSSRCTRANNYWKSVGKPSNCLYISLHANASGNGWSNARGVEVYSANNASAETGKAAKLINDAIYNDVKAIDSGFKNRGHKKANYYVIKNTSPKAVLVEYEFYSNKDGVALLKNKRDLLCEATLKGVCQYFGVKYTSAPVTSPSKPAKPVTQIKEQEYGNGTYNKNFKVTTSGDALTVRDARPVNGKLGNVLGSLPNGSIILGGYCLNNWMGIKFNGKQGFVSAKYLTLEGANNPQVPSTKRPFKDGSYSIKAKVTANELNVRKGRPGDANYSRIIDKLTKGEIVTVHYCLNGWFSIYDCENSPGFISGDYIELILN